MSRLTINLPDDLHRSLKTAAARRSQSIGALVRESLEAYGIKPESEVAELLERARAHSGLDAEQAQALANAETRAHRQDHPASR